MRTPAKILAAMATVAVTVLAAAGAQERKVQFAAEAGAFFGNEEGGSGLLFGLRVDFNLSKSIMISPELLFSGGDDYGWGVMFPSCTVNYRFGKAFVGVGVGIVVVGSPLMAKVQVGTKSRHWILAGFFQSGGTGGWLTFGGATVGYIF